MALLQPSDRDDTARGLLGLSDAQLGSVAEDQLVTATVDPQLLVVILPCANDGSLHDTAFVIPAADIPAITTASSDRGDPGYQGGFTLEPIAAKMRPFVVPTEELRATVLERLFALWT